jgi:hypothetical protein
VNEYQPAAEKHHVARHAADKLVVVRGVLPRAQDEYCKSHKDGKFAFFMPLA